MFGDEYGFGSAETFEEVTPCELGEGATGGIVINATMVSDWTMAATLQKAGHDVYWFENGWYHSRDCPECNMLVGVNRDELREG